MAGFVPLKNLKLQLQERDFPNLVSSLPYKKKEESLLAGYARVRDFHKKYYFLLL
jgi:hypothetical protein